MQKIAISACLLGRNCRYNAEIKRDELLIKKLSKYQLIPFCPEDFCYGTPRPSMDLIETSDGIKALSNLTGADLTAPIVEYARAFFDSHPDIELYIGKDRSPSCGVCSAKLYSMDKVLLSDSATGLMADVAKVKGIICQDAESLYGSSIMTSEDH